jgi:NAD(P)-dependent dehydrogenase (short-subunit alcohol dehydrogenase family)
MRTETAGMLKDRVAIVTGASQGLGLEIAKKYAAAGASLAICARDAKPLTEAENRLRSELVSGQKLLCISGDVSRVEEVEHIVEQTMQKFGRIDILVNNAGIYGPKGAIDDVRWDEWVYAIEVNLYGSILMCRTVLPYFKARRKGKIVQLSGGGATNPLPNLSAYAVSKAAIVRFIETLADEVKDYGIEANAIAPGTLNTRMLDEVLMAGPEKVGRAFYERMLKQREGGGTPLKKGAELAVYLGSPLSDGITGKLISALWDPWDSFSEHLAELSDTDIYTLRRIVPKDRGKAWGTV